MHHLKAAVEAALPIIAVYTDDLVNAVPVMKEVLGAAPVHLSGSDISKLVSKNKVLYTVSPEFTDKGLAIAYEKLVSEGRSMIVVNPKPFMNIMFDAGALPVPETLMREQIEVVVDDEATIKKMLLLLGGCSLKEAAELIRMTMVKTAALTPQGLAHTRRELFKGLDGLFPVDTDQPFYIPNPELVEWLSVEKDYFLHSNEVGLRPRGLLMDGPPGVGKSSGAKWIAEQIGVPLYLLSAAGAKDKWVGNSEKNFAASLRKIEQEAPCVVLIDEIEKVFSEGYDQGTTSTMLAQLLWWLQEHKSRVLTVMTTNSRASIPPELYRPGRIDKVMDVPNANEKTCQALIMATAKSFKAPVHGEAIWQSFQLKHKAEKGSSEFSYSHAFVVEHTKEVLKLNKVGL